uniref:Chromo domain-containing protein n=1 Tax=Chrysemys picta bellii TaxID=8478 RepID=A0A8C3IRX3_CHRPI
MGSLQMNHNEYVIHEILDARIRLGRLWYLGSWEGYSPVEHSWEPAENVHAPYLVNAFHKNHPGKHGPLPPGECSRGGGNVSDHSPQIQAHLSQAVLRPQPLPSSTSEPVEKGASKALARKGPHLQTSGLGEMSREKGLNLERN